MLMRCRVISGSSISCSSPDDETLRSSDHPPGCCTRTMRYSPMSKASFDVPARVVVPVTPVFDCQVTFQLEVAVIGHLPVPPVRSLSDRQRNMYPQGGWAFQS